jgi:hypothetical protein
MDGVVTIISSSCFAEQLKDCNNFTILAASASGVSLHIQCLNLQVASTMVAPSPTYALAHSLIAKYGVSLPIPNPPPPGYQFPQVQSSQDLTD